MSDDMGDKIKQIADLFGQNSNANIPDNVKGLFNMLVSNAGSNNSNEESPSEDTSQKSRTSDSSSEDDTDEMADMARKMKKAMNMMSTTANDPRVNLLNAIKPYLNKSRQKKLQNCMKLIRLGSLTKVLDDSE